MRRIIMLAVAGAVALAPLAAASGASAQPQRSKAGACSNDGMNHNSCQAISGSNLGIPVRAETLGASGWDEAEAITITTTCGNGRVSNANSCPFDPGSGMNSLFNNDQIGTVDFTANDHCIGDSSDQTEAVAVDCASGNGRLWVFRNNDSMVNILASDTRWENNGENNGVYLHNTGNGNQLALDETYMNDGSDQWGVDTLP